VKNQHIFYTSIAGPFWELKGSNIYTQLYCIFVRMKMTLSVQEFIEEHMGDDLNRLLLSGSRYPEIDIPFVVDQIMARKQIREKLPEWYANPSLIFPSKIAVEQCSSEYTARYKQRLIQPGQTVCDLTGGLGIDSYYFSRKAEKVIYIERFGEYCEAARHNFPLLRADNIEILHGDGTELYQETGPIDVFYIDPARRGEGNKRLYALSECEPDLTRLLPALITKAPKVVAKISPMADIRQTLQLLPGTSTIHVLAVKNECKELLFEIERESGATPIIHCRNYTTEGLEESFLFDLQQEESAETLLATSIKDYLYEPNVSVLKGGAFKSIALRFGIEKLGISSHLYTSGELIDDFPGRTFAVEEVLPFNGKLCKDLVKRIPQANITVRNFPLSVEDLRKRMRIKDGGENYIFATTLEGGKKVLILCRKEKKGLHKQQKE